jgi:hypothetical protein
MDVELPALQAEKTIIMATRRTPANLVLREPFMELPPQQGTGGTPAHRITLSLPFIDNGTQPDTHAASATDRRRDGTKPLPRQPAFPGSHGPAMSLQRIGRKKLPIGSQKTRSLTTPGFFQSLSGKTYCADGDIQRGQPQADDFTGSAQWWPK